MTAIGETLRSERKRRNLELDQICRELKISPKFLEAIESEQFDKLPGIVFAKSFVRQYARLLGLDEEELAAEVQRAMGSSPSVPQFAQSHHSAPEIRVPRVEEWESANSKSSALPALAGLVVVMLACSGVYAWWQRPRHTAPVREEVAAPTAQLSPAPAPPAAETPAAPAATAAEPPVTPSPASSQPAAQAQAPAPDTAAPPPAAVSATVSPALGGPTREAPSQISTANRSAPVRVEVTADEPVWVLAKTDGKYLFSGTLEARQTRTMEAAGTVMLRLGNAGGVSITLNGKPIGAVGPKGQVRTVQLTSGGFQIVVAPKPSLPLDDLL